MTTEAPPRREQPSEKQLERVTIRFAGDSGDGMQLTGTQFTRTAAAFGNDISTFPDFPAEIRAPAGSLPGVSGFQLSFSSSEICSLASRLRRPGRVVAVPWVGLDGDRLMPDVRWTGSTKFGR